MLVALASAAAWAPPVRLPRRHAPHRHARPRAEIADDTDYYELRFGGTARMLGNAGQSNLRAASVCVIGLGGVGSWAVEALARSGVGALTLMDLDEVCISNTNRQLHSLSDTVGRSKAAVLAERVARINPECAVRVREEWFTLDEQKEHVREYIARRLAESRDGEKCVVVGHSIGAHIALHARRELGREKVHGVIGLMPFLHVNTRSALQKSLNFVTRLSLVTHALGKLLDGLRAFAPTARVFLLRNAVTKSMDTTAAEITSAWLRWQSLINMVFMGRTEFDALTVPVTECPLVADAALPSDFAAVYARDDHWAPLHQRDALASIDVDVTTIDGVDVDVKHDFVVNDASSRVVASSWCAPIVARLAA